jgi:hypothetical protein
MINEAQNAFKKTKKYWIKFFYYYYFNNLKKTNLFFSRHLEVPLTIDALD